MSPAARRARGAVASHRVGARTRNADPAATGLGLPAGRPHRPLPAIDGHAWRSPIGSPNIATDRCWAPPGTIGLLPGSLDQGFADAETTVIAPADLLGASAIGGPSAGVTPFAATLAPGDAVIHIEHGMAKLRGIETIETNDCLHLAYAGETGLLVRVEDIHLVWRYGVDTGAVALDRLNTEAWPKRRAAIEQDIAAIATRLVALAQERETTRAPVMRPDRRAYERFAASSRWNGAGTGSCCHDRAATLRSALPSPVNCSTC